MPKFTVKIASFPFGRVLDPDVKTWFARTLLAMKADPRVGEIIDKDYDDTPITMTRNRCIKNALAWGVDYLVMVDNDMSPDIAYADSKPFWKSSFDFAVNRGSPCIIGAPYCGPPPVENVYVFRWAKMQSNHPNPADFQVKQYDREEAALMTGIQQVAALPTGLILIDMRAIAALPPRKPWFYYEYTDPEETQKASTEDVTFTRDIALAGIPIFCNWDAWADHWKRKRVGKPTVLTVDTIRDNLRHALQANVQEGQQQVQVPRGGYVLKNGRPIPCVPSCATPVESEVDQ